MTKDKDNNLLNLFSSYAALLIACAIVSVVTNFVLSYAIDWPMTFGNFGATFGFIYCYRVITKFSVKDFINA